MLKLAFHSDHSYIHPVVEQQSPNYYENNCAVDTTRPVCDQSLWVNNTTGCVWRATDDGASVTGTGYVQGSVSGSVCMISDWEAFPNWGGEPIPVSVGVYAPSDTLRVTLSNNLGVSWNVPAVPNGRDFQYVLCAHDNTPGPYPPVPGSNGGIGTRVLWTVTVTSVKRTSNVRATLQVGNGIWGFC